MHLDFIHKKDQHTLKKTNISLRDSLGHVDANEEEE